MISIAIRAIVVVVLSINLLFAGSSASIDDDEPVANVFLPMLKGKKYDESFAKQGNAKAQYDLGIMYLKDGNYEKAYKWFKLAGHQGNKEALTEIGRLYLTGYGVVDKSNLKAFEYFNKACDKKEYDSCQYVSYWYLDDYYTPRDLEKAYFYLQKADSDFYGWHFLYTLSNDAVICRGLNELESFKNFGKNLKELCDNGDAHKCKELGNIYACENNPSEAILFYKKSCDLKNAKACNTLALIYELGRNNVEKDIKKSLAYYVKACEYGDTHACYYAGSAYSGMYNNIQIDDKLAFSAYNMGCKLKDGISCSAVASSYADGKGVYKDEFKAFQLYESTCKEYNICNGLASAYYYGNGTRQNYTEALKYYVKECQRDSVLNSSICFSAGKMYEEGLGTKRDIGNAKKFYLKAFGSSQYTTYYAWGKDRKKTFIPIQLFKVGCDLKRSNSCNDLGKAYLTGDGIDKDLKSAKYYFGLACDLKNQSGCDEYGKLNKNGI